MDAKRRCLLCDREVGWLAHWMHENFCSTECSAKYRDQINSLAIERLNAARILNEEALAAAGDAYDARPRVK